MISHKVLISGEDVSEWVEKINVQQSIETGSDPGKINITLANCQQRFTNKWPPQKTPIEIWIYNWVYRDSDTYPAPRGPATYLVATGKMTDNQCDHEDAVVKGECDLGHLADALPPDVDKHMTTPKETLEYVLSTHPDYPITFDWDPALDPRNRWKERETYGADWQYQDFLDDICANQLGAIYYFNEANRLQIKDPYSNVGVIDLDPYVITPMQTTSIMGFKNAVVVVGDESKSKNKVAISVEGSLPIISEYPHGLDLDSIGTVGWLTAPVYRDHNIKTIEEANQKADELLRFYKRNQNALTTIEVAGILPPLQSIVEYSPFDPISKEDQDILNKALADLLAKLQAKEHDLASEQDRLEQTIVLSSKVRGIVVNKAVDYSIEGLVATVGLSPGLVKGKPITDDYIIGSVLNYTNA